MDVAIIGTAFRFPGANDDHAFWTNLSECRSSITVVPETRWDWRPLWGDAKLEVDKSSSKWGGFIDHVDAFDHEFFGLLPKVVRYMDPQQRIMLELAWLCLEDAGVPPSTLRGRNVGVFAGLHHHDYQELLATARVAIEAYHYTGTACVVIPNRISHVFGFRGPSLPVDTACSSTLNAMHLAIQSIEQGESELALAGGISLILNPWRHVSISKMGTLSPTGSCKTLDDRADGYVRGEGAGFYLLKPLDKAVADGDRIHGVIKGSAVNHCGKTHTLSYPSAEAQADVIVAAHERAGVPIDTVNFVELHGTGTAKGDPIEFEGLCLAYNRLAERQGITLEDGLCGLSSAKTNIGHLEAAAGAAGVAKVLLAFKHRKMPGLHDFRDLNSRITIEGTPFVVLDKTREWSPRNADTPLRAGVSSFGFGGTNAHLVLEAPPPQAAASNAGKARKAAPQLVVLSARTAGALRRRKQDLLAWLDADAGTHTLEEVACALLLERDHLPLRFACVADDLSGLRDALSASTTAAPATQGDEARIEAAGRDAAGLLLRYGRLKGAKRRDALQTLVGLFLDGAVVDIARHGAATSDNDLAVWEAMFPQRPSRRPRLPVYAFERHRSWVPDSAVRPDISGQQRRADDSAPLHPLLHQHLSVPGQQRFVSTFDGTETCLRDHVVLGKKTLPGVAYLEMVRAAFARVSAPDATLTSSNAAIPVRISDVVWLRPLTVEDRRVEALVEFVDSDAAPRDARDLRFDAGFHIRDFRVSIHAADGQTQLLCRGRVEAIPAAEATPGFGYADGIVLDGQSPLESEPQSDWRSIDDIYADFAAQGIDYGHGHRVLATLRIDRDHGVARLVLPEALRAEAEHCTLHPGIVDGALQAAVAFYSASRGESRVRAAIPFALDSAAVLRAPIGTVHACVKIDAQDRLDVDLVDGADGRIFARLRGLSTRPLGGAPAVVEVTRKSEAAVLSVPTSLIDSLYVVEWQPQSAAALHAAPPHAATVGHVLLVGSASRMTLAETLLRASSRFATTRFSRLEVLDGAMAPAAGTAAVRAGVADDYVAAIAALATNGGVPSQVLLLPAPPADRDASVRVAASAQHVFALVKAMFRGTKAARFVQIAAAGDDVELLALGGLWKTLRIEKPGYSGLVAAGLADWLDAADVRFVDAVADELIADGGAIDIRYRDGQREVRGFSAVGATLPLAAHSTAFREGGVYLITGGLGAIGRIVARHLCAHYRAHVYLTGRSEAGAEQLAAVAGIAALGGSASYLACDLSDREDVARAVASIHADGHRLHGVLHSAGMIKDNFMLRKSAEEFAAVIAPKTLGTWHLDAATRDEPLDMFVLFSSVAGALGNVGQCDYAYGNAFKDAFAHEREMLRARGQRNGRSLSINWPFWQNGGMRLGDAQIEAVRRNFGIVPLADEAGIDALEFALAQDSAQLLVMPGDALRVREVLGAKAPVAASDSVPAAAAVVAVDSEAVARMLSETFGEQLKMPPAFEPDKLFKDYGVDSVIMIELVALLEKTFGTLPKTLFFEHPNLARLTDYFVSEHAATCRAVLMPVPLQGEGSYPAVSVVEADTVGADVIAGYLGDLFAEQLHITSGFDPDKQFKDYGVDSVIMIELVALLEKTFGTLPKTLFFEYPNLGDLSGYFRDQHAETCQRVLRPVATEAPQQQAISQAPTAPQASAAPPVRAAALEARSASRSASVDEGIAIIGLAGRYPKADSLHEFWDNLKTGRDCVDEIPDTRGELATGFRFRPGESERGSSYAKWGGLLSDVDQFDPLFFNIAPKEAQNMDPNERLFLEIASQAIEDAGYTPDTLASRRGHRDNPVGVYVGVMWGDYQLHGVDAVRENWTTPHSFYWAIANRVSHHFDFSGPSLALDTACSSSLTAIHLACQALRLGEIDVAVAGAVNLSLHPNKYNLLSDLRFLSTDGRCRSFGEGGSGYVPGEGVGAVLLKPLSRALADGDHIHGVIRGSAVNHGGKSSGFTVPNGHRQADLIRDALDSANIDPRHIGYVEAHGTGTKLGDPIEMNALSKALSGVASQSCPIGSCKSNLGHLEAAAGMAALSKVLLQMRHGMLVPSIHSDTLNQFIEFERTPFRVQQVLSDWPRIQSGGAALPRIAGISSFGAGGSNGHLIIEEAPALHASPADVGPRQPALILLSARKEAALTDMAGRLADALVRDGGIDLHDAAYTLQIGRIAMEHRLAIVGESTDAIIATLRAWVDGRSGPNGGVVLCSGHRDNAKRDGSLGRRQSDSDARLRQAGNAPDWALFAAGWVDGIAIDWRKLHPPGTRRRVSLPGYAFQRQRYWVEKHTSGIVSGRLHSLIDANISTLDTQSFRKVLRADEFFLRDHRLGGFCVLPGTAYLEMAIQAGRLARPQATLRGLSDIAWHKLLIVGDAPKPVAIDLIADGGDVAFEVHETFDDARMADAQTFDARTVDSRTVYAHGILRYEDSVAGMPMAEPPWLDIRAIVARCRSIDQTIIADRFAQMGFGFGPGFQVFDTLHSNADEALASLRLPVMPETRGEDFLLHPALLDGALRTVLAIGGLQVEPGMLMVPVGLQRLRVLAPLQADCHAYARRVSVDPASGRAEYDVQVVDGEGRLLVAIERLSAQPVPLQALTSMRAQTSARAAASRPSQTVATQIASTQAVSLDAGLRPSMVDYLKGIVAATTGVAVSEIDPGLALEHYGIDSVMIAKLTSRLQETFGEVSKTLFFEFQEIDSLADHLLEEFSATARLLAGTAATAMPGRQPDVAPMHAPAAGIVQGATASAVVDAATYMFSVLQQVLGSEAADCRLATPLAEWPLDPVSIPMVLHALRQDFEDVSGDAPYRHPTLGDWAAQLRWKPGRAEAVATAALSSVVPVLPPTSQREAARGPARLSAFAAGKHGRSSARGRMAMEDIAIIGLAGRYAGADDLHGYWRNLAAGRDSISEIPASRWDHRRYFHPDRTHKGTVYSKWGGFMNGVDQFDARFFNISAREAEITDPQERLFLQTAWECLEDANHTRQSLSGQSVGVFVGVMWANYAQVDVSDEQLKYGRPSSPFASIANRVSYALNFDGPSLAVDTMCSSSLTAIHLACRAMNAGDCDQAIAGGVNLILHPHKYQQLSSSQFLSTDGRCRAFGADGDGYVPGEGVGAVLLKPLSKAEADGDHIYGVIKASSLNHGGKTNGYTVPNQVAQTAVIAKALRGAGWEPDSIDYIEAHGTGTPLGDPIEIAALSRAFSTVADELGGQGAGAKLPKQRCRIGSVKSNIGHLESAAGIAGLTKILLQFRHRTIAPSLHAATLNPNIDFARTPFRVVQAAEAWQPGDGRTTRRAGLSSFGAGGANAHCLIEDHPRPAPVPAPGTPELFVLSADTDQRLDLYIDRVIDFLGRGGDPDVGLDLRALAWSSQVGREAMDARIAVVAESIDALHTALRAHRAGEQPAQVFRSVRRKQAERLEAIVEDSEKDALIRSMIGSRRLPQLARAWVSMLDIDWARYRDALYPAGIGGVPLRMPFPTMPFMTERYWVEEATQRGAARGSHHPLIGQNLSTLAQQAYRKEFDGTEFYLRDHVVHTDRDRNILPGVAYLEMARAAGDLALGESWRVESIRNLIWIQPFEIADSVDSLDIRLHPGDDALSFQIVRASDGVTCVEGELGFGPIDSHYADEYLDIAALRANGSLIEPDHEAIYDAFSRMGFHYGPGFRATRARWRMPEGALCHLRLPGVFNGDLGGFVLHPGLMDAAVRSGLAVGEGDAPMVPIVPFALEALELRHPLGEECYVYALPVTDSAATAGEHRDSRKYKFDIVIADSDGLVLVKLHGFTGRAMVKAPAAPQRVLQYFDEDWVSAPLLSTSLPTAEAGNRVPMTWLVATTDTALVDAMRRALPDGDLLLPALIGATGINAGIENEQTWAALGEAHSFDPMHAQSAEAIFASLRERGLTPDRIVYLDSDVDALAVDAFDGAASHRGIQAVRHLFTACERSAPGMPVRLLYAYRDNGTPQPQHDAIFGFARSLLTVNHRFELSTLRDDRSDADARAKAIVEEMAVASGFGANEIAWRDGRRLRRTLRAISEGFAGDGDALGALTLREQGCYLITGGAGKLGLLLARYFAERCRARLVLGGRSPQPSSSVIEAMDALRAIGAEVIYISADTSNPEEVAGLIATIEQTFGSLHGVIHCAGVASERQLLDLSDAEFDEMLSPKLDGLVVLDRATARQPLDFFIAFSSVSALLGDLGACAYAVGNRFMDTYAVWRDGLCSKGLRNGRSISINWPLWATGGMEISDTDASVFGFSGMQALTEAEGLEAFEKILRSRHDRVLVSIGDPQRVARALRLLPPPAPAPVSTRVAAVPTASAPTRQLPVRSVAPAAQAIRASAPPPAAAQTDRRNADTVLLDYVKRHMAAVLKSKPETIDNEASFEQCGMDSVLMMELHSALRTDLPELPKTALFEHDTATRMAAYLRDTHAEKLRVLLGTDAAGTPSAETTAATVVGSAPPAPAVVTAPTAPRAPLPAFKRMPSVSKSTAAAVDDDAVAIIGIAGEFPSSPDLDTFWSHVRDGHDCLSRIPGSRGFAGALSRQPMRAGQAAIADKGGFLSGVDQFDCALFRMSQTEADKADPQLRVLLRTAWRAVEDAAYTPEALAKSKVGVYIGAMNEDFTWIAAELQSAADHYLGPGAVSSELSNRLSYLMNFCGPSLTLSTACSASLTAVHLARRAILAGECDAALAGGVNLSLHQSKYRLLHDMKVLSPDGLERTFDDRANGLVPSEGAGVVVLKRLSTALADGDHIHGVIRASRIGHSGTGAGQFLPNIRVMEETAADCLHDAGLSGDDLTYLETHGTGTELGDPIELKALANALRRTSSATGYCAIGTKANLGHMEAASGICSLIKVLLSMRHGQIAPCARLQRVNSSFDTKVSPFFFPQAATAWSRNPRGTYVAGINSFGMGGSNAFVVIESLTPETARSQPAQQALFLLSARSDTALRAHATAMAVHLRSRIENGLTPAEFEDLAYASQVGRQGWRHRLAVCVTDALTLVATLDAYAADPGHRDSTLFAGDIQAATATDIRRVLVGEAGNGFIDALIISRQLSTLAELWVRGAAIPWQSLHAGQARRRAPLPGVPFENVRCDLRHLITNGQLVDRTEGPQWVVDVVAAEAAPSAADSGSAEVVLAGWHRLTTIPPGEMGAQHDAGASVADADLRQYWVDHLGTSVDTAIELATTLRLDTTEEHISENVFGVGQTGEGAQAHAGISIAAGQGEIHCVSEIVDAELVQAIQQFGARHAIALETLIAAAWSVLLNRHTKARFSQFAMLGACDVVEVGESILLPVRVRTVGRQKIGEWLNELQADLLRKHHHAHAPIERIGEWVGREPLFDTAVVFHDALGGSQDRAQLASARHAAPVRMELVAAASDNSLELSLLYRATTPDYDKAGTLLEQFTVLLEGIVSNPDKLPSALGMRTKTESRDRFWKTMEAAVD